MPGFKPATAEEIARRHSAADPDPGSRYYAVEDGAVVGYAAFGPNGRVSAPWCLPGAEASREPLLRTVLAAMGERGIPEAWAAYRADWSPVLDLLRGHGFLDEREMINYVAEVAELPANAVLPANRAIEPMGPESIRDLLDLAPGLYPEGDPSAIERFFRENPFHDFTGDLVALKDADSGETRAIGLLVVDGRFADPTKIDPAMPCFRLGAFGTEHQRHKRVNGLFSAVSEDEADGEMIARVAGRDPRPAGRARAHRGPGPFRCARARCPVRPLLPTSGRVPDPVAAVAGLSILAILTPRSVPFSLGFVLIVLGEDRRGCPDGRRMERGHRPRPGRTLRIAPARSVDGRPWVPLLHE